MNQVKPTKLAGISYFIPSIDQTLAGLDGRVEIKFDGIPVPLLDADFQALTNEPPSYDAVGRGIYHILRLNPDCAFASYYAQWLKDAYPHFITELATHIVMLDKKDVEINYLDRKINYLKIFALLEPEDFKLPLAIGECLLDKGMRLSALHMATINIFKAETFLQNALQLSSDDIQVRNRLGEVSYILGKYEGAVFYWRGILDKLKSSEADQLKRRMERIENGIVPKVPSIDYLQAVGEAFQLFQSGNCEEPAAILLDVLEDEVFCEEFPLAEIRYFVGICYREMGISKYAEDYLKEALRFNPDYVEAREALDNLYT